MAASLLLLLCLLVGSLEANNCPAKEDVWPCTCAPSKIETHLKDVECTSLRKPEELLPPVQALGKNKTRVYRLRIENSTLSFFPDILFQDVHIEQVYFEETKIIRLSEHRTAFIGLENVLEGIYLMHVDFATVLDLNQFRNLKKLDTIIFDRCRMHSAVPTFPHLPKLTWLAISNSEISSVSYGAFRELSNLSHFDMSYNKITELRRSMLPNPAESLSFIDLSWNRLSFLPQDFFENMPILEFIYLENNKFVTMEEKPFVDVFKSSNLERFWMQENTLHCDCKLSWMGNVRFPKNFYAKCATPEALSGKEVRSLDFESLRCYSGQSL